MLFSSYKYYSNYPLKATGEKLPNLLKKNLIYIFNDFFCDIRFWHKILLGISGTTEIKFLTKKSTTMLRWTVIFFIVAIIAAVFGFGGIASGAASIAKILFFIFIILFLVSLIFGKSFNRS